MNNSSHSLSENSVFAFLHAAQALQERLEEAFGEVGLSASRFGVLDQLVRAGTPLPLSELAARQSCVRSNMTQLVDRLEADGLVRRIDDPADRRAVRAELTGSGLERHSQGAKRLQRVQDWFDSTIASADKAALGRIAAALR